MSDDKQKKHDKEIDDLSGVETTGHEWDGLKELNNPLPRWWVWIFLVTVVWSIWYFVVYPAWPTLSGATQGTSGYTQFKELVESQNEIIEVQSAYAERFGDASFAEIMADEQLYAFAMAGGASAFKDNCATCHGTGGAGAEGYPNLNDDDWLWGGKVEEIHQTILHGIRSGDIDAHQSQMPAFGKDRILSSGEISKVTDYVLSLSSGEESPHHTKGRDIFQQQCASCHGTDAKGLKEFGAPNLADKIWLFGGDRKSVYNSIYYAHAGVMPAWKNRLDENTIKQLAIYLHELGGGE